jgi:hypothetical protein
LMIRSVASPLRATLSDPLLASDYSRVIAAQ